MYSVVINGFETKEQAQAFFEEYEGQGEQDMANWFEKRCEDDPTLNMTAANVDHTVPKSWVGNKLHFTIKVL